MDDAERIRRAVEHGDYVGDVAPLLRDELVRVRTERRAWEKAASALAILGARELSPHRYEDLQGKHHDCHAAAVGANINHAIAAVEEITGRKLEVSIWTR